MRSGRFAVLFLALLTGCLALSLVVRGRARATASLVTTDGTVVTMDGTDRVIADGAVAVDGDRIFDVDTAEAIDARYNAPDRIDARGQVVLPGLINGHTHAPMVLFRGLAEPVHLPGGEKDGWSIAAHAIWVGDDDLTRLATRHVGLVHNPASNMKLASGVAPVAKWIAHGVAAGLGTDEC